MDQISAALSPLARRLTLFTAVMFGLVGVVLFVAPHWAAANFAWQISPFVAMTMGGWYMGMGVVALEAARLQRWSLTHACQIVVWSFGLLEGLLLIIHGDVLRFDTPLALLYVLTLAIASINTVVGVGDWARTRPRIEPEGLPNPWWSRAMSALFVVYVTYLAVPLLAGYARGGTVWPGQLSLLTARCFGAFFFSLVLGMVPLVWARRTGPVTPYMLAGQALVVPITLAALVFIGQFNFRQQPGGLLYIGSYLVAFVGASLVLLYVWLTRRRASAPAGATTGGVS